ncbi:MAG: C39 family peptidase [Oscillospiraceae bacterium]
MNKKPCSYLQTDARWKNVDYSAKGESTTIGASGCGPTSAAMLIETLTGRTYTPVDACKWSLSHGYKAVNQGTYYSYFKPQFAAFGIDCKQLNGASVYGNPNASVHAEAFSLLKKGYYLIACMGKGLWTSSGHYIVVWWEDGKVRINDPASTRTDRLNGDLQTFKSQVKYYWAIDAQEYNKELTEEEDDEDMVRYERLTDIPSNYNFRNIVELLMDAKIILGDGSDPNGNNDVIDVSHDMLRMLIWNYRGGCYDTEIRNAGLDPDLYK